MVLWLVVLGVAIVGAIVYFSNKTAKAQDAAAATSPPTGGVSNGTAPTTTHEEN